MDCTGDGLPPRSSAGRAVRGTPPCHGPEPAGRIDHPRRKGSRLGEDACASPSQGRSYSPVTQGGFSRHPCAVLPPFGYRGNRLGAFLPVRCPSRRSPGCIRRRMKRQASLRRTRRHRHDSLRRRHLPASIRATPTPLRQYGFPDQRVRFGRGSAGPGGRRRDQVLPIPAVSPGILPAMVVIMSSRLVPRTPAAATAAPARTAMRIAYSSTVAPVCPGLLRVRRMVRVSRPPVHARSAAGSWFGMPIGCRDALRVRVMGRASVAACTGTALLHRPAQAVVCACPGPLSVKSSAKRQGFGPPTGD